MAPAGLVRCAAECAHPHCCALEAQQVAHHDMGCLGSTASAAVCLCSHVQHGSTATASASGTGVHGTLCLLQLDCIPCCATCGCSSPALLWCVGGMLRACCTCSSGSIACCCKGCCVRSGSRVPHALRCNRLYRNGGGPPLALITGPAAGAGCPVMLTCLCPTIPWLLGSAGLHWCLCASKWCVCSKGCTACPSKCRRQGVVYAHPGSCLYIVMLAWVCIVACSADRVDCDTCWCKLCLIDLLSVWCPHNCSGR